MWLMFGDFKIHYKSCISLRVIEIKRFELNWIEPFKLLTFLKQYINGRPSHVTVTSSQNHSLTDHSAIRHFLTILMLDQDFL